MPVSSEPKKMENAHSPEQGRTVESCVLDQAGRNKTFCFVPFSPASCEDKKIYVVNPPSGKDTATSLVANSEGIPRKTQSAYSHSL